MHFLFSTVLYNPLYNALVGLIDLVPGGDIGFAVIILTIIVKLAIFPLSTSSIRTQIKMKDIDSDIKEIREKFKDNKEEMGRKILELYRANKINPFAGIFLILIQLPIIIALYYVFANGGFPVINPDILYSFVPQPEFVNTNFLGLIDLSKNNNLVVALFAAISQYYQTSFIMQKNIKELKQKSEKTPMDDIMKSMQFQMKYIMPIITFFISFSLISVVGLYWFVTNVFAIGQEIYIQKRIRNPLENQE